MSIKIQNADEAGMTQRAITTAQHILDLLDQVECEAQTLDSLHWYGDVPDTQDARDILISDIKVHFDELGRWNGNWVSQPAVPIPSQNMVDLSHLQKLQTYAGS